MKKELRKLIKAATAYKEYQSIGNASKLNVAIEEAEALIKNEKRFIERVLKKHKWDIDGAAYELGVKTVELQDIAQEHGIVIY